MNIPDILQTISKEIKAQNAKAIIVGGSVRDHFLGLAIKDYDIEVYGLSSIEKLETLLKAHGIVKLVGKSFGVLKFVYGGDEYDFAFPRREKKVGMGHRGFEVVADGFMVYKEAARRRDFTINAMGYDIEEGIFLDPYDGKKDLRKKIIRHIDEKTFIEDPLRLYRGVQFCARFQCEMADETKLLCQSMVEKGDLETLPKARIFEELKKLLLKAKKPSIGFRIMRELGALKYFPELFELSYDIWQQMLESIDKMADMLHGDSKKDLILMLAVLTSKLGQKEVETVLLRVTDEIKLIDAVKPLSMLHLMPQKLFLEDPSDSAIRKLSTKVSIEDLVKVALASGQREETIEWLLEHAKKLEVLQKPPPKLLQGRDLLALGFKPSKAFSTMLDIVYEKQLEGKLMSKEAALEYVKNMYIKE